MATSIPSTSGAYQRVHVVPINDDGTATDSLQFEQEFTGTPPLLLYIGEAPVGAGTSDLSWRIRKFFYDGNFQTALRWAGSSQNFDKAWTLRATYGYSRG